MIYKFGNTVLDTTGLRAVTLSGNTVTVRYDDWNPTQALILDIKPEEADKFEDFKRKWETSQKENNGNKGKSKEDAH